MNFPVKPIPAAIAAAILSAAMLGTGAAAAAGDRTFQAPNGVTGAGNTSNPTSSKVIGAAQPQGKTAAQGTGSVVGSGASATGSAASASGSTTSGSTSASAGAPLAQAIDSGSAASSSSGTTSTTAAASPSKPMSTG